MLRSQGCKGENYGKRSLVWGEELFPGSSQTSCGAFPACLDSPGHCLEVPRADPTASRTAQRPGAGQAQARVLPRLAHRDPPGARQRPATVRVLPRAGSQSPPLPSPRPALPAGRSCPACGKRPVASPARGLRVPALRVCAPELSPSSETDELSVSSSSELLPSFSA